MNFVVIPYAGKSTDDRKSKIQNIVFLSHGEMLSKTEQSLLISLETCTVQLFVAMIRFLYFYQLLFDKKKYVLYVISTVVTLVITDYFYNIQHNSHNINTLCTVQTYWGE